MRNFIINQLKLLGKHVNSDELLVKYVDFCLDNALTATVPRKTAHHHILPVARLLPFKKYKSLVENPWNGVILTHYNHYYAHYLLSLAINHVSISHAFCAMHNKNPKLKILNEDELISEVDYNNAMIKRNEESSRRNNEIIEVNGVKMSRIRHIRSMRKYSLERREKMSKRMKGKNNNVYKEGVVDKIRSTKLNNGMDKIGAERAAATMKTPFVDVDGNITTIYEQTAQRYSVFLKTEYLNERGELTTKAKEYGKERSLRMVQQGKWFILKHIKNENVNIILPEAMIRKISAKLMFKTKMDYLGKSKYGQNYLTKVNKTHLIGLYCDKLEEVPQNYNPDQDYTPYL